MRLLSQFARVYTYERSGYGRSRLPGKEHESTNLPTVPNRAEELTRLLDVAKIHPPWVLVGHSYGGNLVREVLTRHGSGKVKGLVIFDSGAERSPLPPNWTTLLGNATYQEVVGLEKNRVLSDAEWELVNGDDRKNGETAELEGNIQKEGVDELNKRIAGKQLLRDGRLSVIFGNEAEDFRKILEWGVKEGNGTEEARAALSKRLEDMSEVDEASEKAHLTLSTNSRFIRAEGKAMTHNLQMIAPELIAREVRWVLSGIEE